MKRNHRFKQNYIIENLEPRRLMCDVSTDLLMQVEGARVLALVPTDGSYFQDIAVQSGDWTDPATWGGSVPKNMDNVWIPQGTDVTISSDLSQDASGNRVAIHALRVDGTLDFNAITNNSLEKLLVDTIVVTGPTVADPNQTGTIQIGTLTQPIPQNVTAEIEFADNGPINAPINTDSALSTLWPDGDPYEFSRGLICMGNAVMNGTEVTSQVSVQPNSTSETNILAGTTTLTLSSVPAGWQVGDQLVLTGNSNLIAGVYQDEQATLQSINTINGITQVTLSTPLQYSHYAVAGASIYLGDLTRNVIFTSENTATQDRGHIMFMHAVNPEQIDAVAFDGLGRTDKSIPINDPVPIIDPNDPGTPDHPNYIESPGTGTNPRGRYAVHFHHDCQGLDPGDTPGTNPDTINDCAVDGSPGWGIVNHTSNVDVTNNIVYKIFGAAYVTEAGDEIGSFDHNIAIDITGVPGAFETRDTDNDFGFDGEGFWFQGGDISVTNNIAADVNVAFMFFARGLDQKLPVSVDANGKYTFQKVTTEIPLALLSWLSNPPIDPVTGMVADDSVPLMEFSNNTAFDTNEGGFQAWGSTPSGTESIINNLQVYDTRNASIFTPYSHGFIFNNLVLIGDVNDASDSGVGVRTNQETFDFTLNNPVIEGFAYGIQTPQIGVTTINGGIFQNVDNIYITPAGPSAVIGGAQYININNVTYIPVSQASAHYQQQYNIFYPTNFNLTQPNMDQLYNSNVGTFSVVFINNEQLYYNEQAFDFVPFPNAFPGIPSDLIGLTNSQIYSQYGLAIGGAVAPSYGIVNPPGIYGILDGLIPSPNFITEENYIAISYIGIAQK